jgi:hypothetical protein
MHTSSNIDDGATVIKEPMASRNGCGKEVALSSVSKSHSTFAKISDYISEEPPPFFVLIGKKGIIDALQELDQLLRRVCVITSHAVAFSPPSVVLCCEPF